MHDGWSFDQTYSVVGSDDDRTGNEDKWNNEEDQFAPDPLGYWEFVSNFADNVVGSNVDVNKLNLVIFFGHVVRILMMVDDVL